MYANDSLNDCVIAARAHQTIRLVRHSSSQPPPPISDSDVTREYWRETGGPNNGLTLRKSLEEWRTSGWQIGNDDSEKIEIRKIEDYSNAYTIEGGRYPGTDPNAKLNEQQLQAGISAYVGAQINLILPQGVAVTEVGSFGPGNDWEDESRSKGDHHVMLLTGYDADGFFGITWAQKQRMNWDFLQNHCFGVYFVKGEYGESAKGPAS
jgi:hypothetical protein